MGPRLSKEALRKRLTELLGPFDLPEKHMPRANEAALWGRHEQPAALVGDRAHQLIAALRDEGRDCAKDEDPRPKRLLEGLLLLQDYQKRGRARQGSSDDENVSVSDTSDSECSKDKSSSSTAAVPAGSRRRQQPRRKRKKLDEKKSRTTAPPSAHEKKTRTTALQTAREKPGSRRRKHAEAVNETSSQSSYDSDATLSASSCSSDSGHERAAGHRDRSGASEARRRKSRAKDRQEEELEDRVKSLAFDHLVSAQAPLPRGGVGQQHLQFITAEVNQHQAVMMQQHEKLLTEFRHLFREEREHSEMQHKQEAHRLAGLRAAAAETNHSVLAAKLQALEKEHEAQRERTAAIQAETAAALSRVERGLASDADKAAVARQAHGAAAAAAADEDGGVRANQRAGSPQGGAPEHATAPPQDGPPPQQREQHQPQQQQQQHHQEQQQQPPPRAAPPVAAAAAAPAAAAAAAAERPPPARGPGKKKDRSRTPPPPARDPVHATTNVSVEIRQPPPGTAQERAADPPAASEAPAKKKKKKGLFTKLFSCAGSSSEKPEGSEAGGDKKEKPPKKAGRKADDETSDSDEEDEPKAKTATEKPRKRWRLPFGRRGAGKDKAKHQLDPVSLEGKYIVKLSEETCVACINAIVASLTSNIGEGETWCYKFLGLDGIGVSSSDKRDVVQGICESDPVSINNERGNEQYAAALMALCKYFNEGRGLVPYRSTQDLLVKKGKVTCEDLQKQLSEMNVAALNLVLQHYHDAVRRVPMGTKERIAGHFAAVAFYGMAESGVDESKTKVLSQWIGDTQPSPVTITIPSPRPPVEADEQGTAQPTGADSSTGDETTAPTQSPLAAPSESPRIAPSVTVTTRIGNDSESSDDAPAERFVPSGMEGYTLKAKGKAS
ncbi:hypothetical protein DIPPA_18425 [Diplonema papillatum]|nr:hypothetical protein DIPPA_18425 [Diplonema papillatum]